MADTREVVSYSDLNESLEEDEGSESDTDSSDSGPLRQAWGPRDIKYDGRKFDFGENFPEDGEQFLLAVRNERKVTPKWVSADASKIKSKPKAVVSESKEESTGNPAELGETTVTTADTNSEAKEETEDVDFELETLQLEDDITNTIKGWSNSQRFRPTPKWRANQLTNFVFIRTKIETTRAMMVEGSFYLVTSFQKFEKDAMYWLRYCFGTSNSGKMIELKRGKKSRKLLAKKLQNCGSGKSGEDGDESDGESTDSESKEPENKVKEDNFEKTEATDEKNVADEDQIPSSTVEEDVTESGCTESGVVSVDDAMNESSTVAIAVTEAVEPEKVLEPESVDMSEASGIIESVGGKIEVIGDSEDELTACFDALRESNKLYGHDPTTSLLLSMPQNLLTFLLSLHLKWLQDFGIMTKKQGAWIYAIMSTLEIPFDSSVISDLRCIALQCAQRRDQYLAHVKKLGDEMDESVAISCLCSSRKDVDNACDFVLLEERKDYSHEDVITTCNLIISLVVDYFVQKDLDELVIWENVKD